MQNMNIDSFYSFKLLLVGNSSVGKSSILLRYADNIFFENTESTIGVDLKLRTHTIDEQLIKLFVWDTAGQDKFKTIVSAYYKGAKVIMFVFDVTDEKSLQDVNGWEDEAEQHTNDEPIKILIANKIDLADKRKVTREQGMKFAEEHQMEYYEASAKRGTNIEGMFDEVARKLFDRFKKPAKHFKNTGKVELRQLAQPIKKSRCC
jgi:Ras-related protein Rab-1A